MAFLEHYLNEVTSDQKFDLQYKSKLDRPVFDVAVALDPTSKGTEKVGNYVDWIIKNDLMNMPDIHDELKTLLTTYHKFKSKLDISKRDINKLKYEDLVAIKDELAQSGGLKSVKDKDIERKKKAESEADKVYEDSDVVVIVPKTQYASQYFGAGSDWCTARQEDSACMFDSYDGRGTLYIIKDKHDNKKYQLFVSTGLNQTEYRNSRNQAFNPFDQFSDYSDFIDWLNEKEFPNRHELTDAERTEIATDILRQLRIDDLTDEEERDAIHTIESAMSMYEDAEEVEDMKAYIEDASSEWPYYFKELLDILEDKYGIDAKHKQNQLLLLPYINDSRDLHYDIERDSKYYSLDRFQPDQILKEFDWKFIADRDLEQVLDSLETDFGTDTVIEPKDKQILKQWLARNYNTNEAEFTAFIENFKDYFNNKVSKEIEDELKELKDDVEKIEYGKQDHPKLDLQSVSFKDYLKQTIKG